jgi:cation diffusion facilitator family transporter
MDKEKCLRCGARAATIALATNIFLAIFKGFIGIVSHSKAVMADAFHSSADIINSLVIILSIKIGSKPPDESHPYGHGKVEFIASIIASSVLMGGACLMIFAAIKCLSIGVERAPSFVAAAAAIVSIMLNILVSTYTFCPGKKLNSLPLITSAWDNRTDAYSSVVVLAGVIGAKVGFPALDPIAAIGIALVIIKAQVGIMTEGVKGLLDASMSKGETKKLINIARRISEVKKVVSIKTRRVGQKFWVDMKVIVDAANSLQKGREIAAAVEEVIKRNAESIASVQVVVEPA